MNQMQRVLEYAQQLGQGYMSGYAPRMNEDITSPYNNGQALANSPGIGVLDDVLRAVPLVAGMTKTKMVPQGHIMAQELEQSARVAGQQLKRNPQNQTLIKLVEDLLRKASLSRLNKFK